MTAVMSPPRTPHPTVTSPRPMTWTCPQFHDLVERGVFESRRPMLIDGLILEQGEMNAPHAVSGIKTEEVFHDGFDRKRWHVRSQKPLVLGLAIDPQPDVALIAGRPDPTVPHPSKAALVLEISDTSLKFDKTEKMSLYAAAAIPEYWVLDLTGRQLIVYRDPVAAPNTTHGGTYRTVITIPATGSVNPLADPALSFAVADLLD